VLEPFADYVELEIVTQLDAEREAAAKRSGILLADRVQGEPDRGRVLAIGPDAKEPGYKVGDLVVFHTKEVFQGMKDGDKNVIFVRHSEILAKINEEA
jgi:co-chaperonin GroES (HSP10)